MNNPFNNFPTSPFGPNIGQPYGYLDPWQNTISPTYNPYSTSVDIRYNPYDRSTLISDNNGYSWKPVDIKPNGFPL